jgi:hypothetical protein
MPKKEERVTIGRPFDDPTFNRSAVYFYDIEFQRKFEQNLIRYGILTSKNATETITKIINSGAASGVGTVGGDGCYWTKDGADLYYSEGFVGVGKIPDTMFNVRGLTRIEADITDTDGDAFLEIVSQQEVVGG